MLPEFRKILCPTDFSDDSYRAVDYGLRFAEASGGRVLLAHIIHVPSGELYETRPPTMTFEQARQRSLALLAEVRETHLKGYANCELLVDIGDPYEQLLRIAKERAVDLIVTSTHGRSGLGHLVIGSVAEKLIRHAPCPVFVVRREAS